MNDISIKRIGAMLAQAAIWWGATWMISYQGNTSWQDACKIASLAAGTWLLGNMQRTGGVMPTLEGLKK
jgi:hypothetical protein